MWGLYTFLTTTHTSRTLAYAKLYGSRFVANEVTTSLYKFREEKNPWRSIIYKYHIWVHDILSCRLPKAGLAP